MPYFKWVDSKMKINVEPLDQEHRALVEIMNYLYERNQAGAEKIEITILFQSLITLTVRHFRNEEAHLASISSPGLPDHKQNHLKLLANLHKHYSAFESGDGLLSDRFFDFLNSWVNEHILGVDTHDTNQNSNTDSNDANLSTQYPIE